MGPGSWTDSDRVAGQNHPQDKLDDWNGARLPMDGEGFRDQLLEAGFLQHGGHWRQRTIGSQIVRFEVLGRRSPNFIELPNRCRSSLIDRPTRCYADLHCSPFG
jgi:hypothetical protein